MSVAPYPQRAAKPNGWWGMAVFVATEATLFGALIGSYYNLRFKTPEWPPAGVPDPKVALPLILLAVLLATSVPVQLAVKRRAWLVVALALQVGYLAVQIQLYADDLNKFTPQGSAYGSIYFTLVGAHHAHVLVGILLEVWLLLRPNVVGLQATAFYWHAVNALAIAVTLVQLSPSL
ncbi:MAG: heme-copper oxidase subunit III [Gaiellaceae bacterium]